MWSGKAVVSTCAALARLAVAAGKRSSTQRDARRPEVRGGSVLVTGTSGKGTTCRMLAEVMRAAGLNPVVPATARGRVGVARDLVERAWTRRVPRDARSIGLVAFEPAALRDYLRREPHPAAVVITNILGGLADGEPHGAAVTARLEKALRSLPASTTLILNADDPHVAAIAADVPNPRLYFGISDIVHSRVRADRTAAALPCCPRCGHPLSYACTYYAHLGHWACGGCGLGRPEPDVGLTKVGRAGPSSSRLQVVATSVSTILDVPLPGMYNAYNVLAALTAATHLGLPAWSLRAIEGFSTGPTQMEPIRVAGHDVQLAVATNAIAYTEVLRAVLGDAEPKRMVLGLNTGHRAQQDISWIWGVDFESLAGLVPGAVITGDRAADLAVRLKYAGWFGDGRDQRQTVGARIEPDPVRAVQAGIQGTPAGEPLWVVSTPAALAEIRRWLRSHDRVPHPETRRRTAPFRADARKRGPQPTRPRAAGPQPSGPSRSAPQAVAGYMAARRSRRAHGARRRWTTQRDWTAQRDWTGWTSRMRRGQSGGSR
ncbi:MAG TPA: MurT ligase domain-containing protein [Streptosporangiaceae bacterium]|nr:MurT ligase domain-containing protein [Streptosporangiaceae bacterium]